MNERVFEVKEEHIKLLRAAYVRWEDCEFGAPAIDCKRPYGNSSVYSDIAEILGIEVNDDGFTYEQKEYMNEMHSGTLTVLQIILVVGYMKPGRYVSSPYGEDWKEVAE